MILERTQLEEMKMAELKALAVEIGIPPSQPSETKDVLINRIIVETAKQPEAQEQEERQPVTPTQCSMDEIKKAVSAHILRGMKVFYNREDNTWLFRIQLKSMAVRDSLTGETRMVERWRDDSGTLNQPLDTIKRCAMVLMQNTPTPKEVLPETSVTSGYEAVA